MCLDVVDFVIRCDVISLAETRLCDFDDVTIPGYVGFFRHWKRYKRKSGGIGVLMREYVTDSVTVYEHN